MKKIIPLSLAMVIVISTLAACTNRDMGTVGGAAIGGVAGNVLTGGSALGTVAGAVGGGVVGNQLAK
jgi:osmotically inducible lipoprotein OsmB